MPSPGGALSQPRGSKACQDRCSIDISFFFFSVLEVQILSISEIALLKLLVKW